MAINSSNPSEIGVQPVPTRQKMATGTIQVFLAEALLLPTGLLTAAYLTRQLGPDRYGLLVLTTTIVGWIGWSITSAFTRTTIKFVGESEDWPAVAAKVLQLHLYLGLAAAIGLCLLAGSVVAALGEPDMANYLRLFSLEIPLFCLSYAHRSVMVGLGQFKQRAIATASRWITRMLLMVGLVAGGLSLWGAILGSVGSALVELLVCRWFLPAPFVSPVRFPIRKLLGYALPLFLLAISMRLYEKLDLFMLKLLGGTAAEAGFYGTAQSLAVIPSLFTLSFVPLLLATLTRLLSNGELVSAQHLSRDSMRFVLLLLPVAGLCAGSASEIIRLLFSSTFLPAAPLLAVLIFGSIATLMVAVTTCILTAAGKPNWTIVLAGPMVPLAMLAHWWFIPRFGSAGAAAVTTVVATLGAVAGVCTIYYLWRVLPPFASLIRSMLVCGVVYQIALLWDTPGWWVMLKLTLLGVLLVPGLLLLGEFSDREKAMVRSWVETTINPLLKRYRPS